MNGCAASGKRSDEKKMPESIHIGSITRFIRPETASIVLARLATNSPSPEKVHGAEQDQDQHIEHAAVIAHVERIPCEDQQDQHLGHHEHHPADHDPAQELALLHRRGQEPLEQLADPQIDGDKADAPQAAPHQAHAQQARHEKVDVPSAGFIEQLVAVGGHVLAAGGALAARRPRCCGRARFSVAWDRRCIQIAVRRRSTSVR